MTSRPITDHLVVPVADEADARVTATALDQFEFGQVTVVHVVEKGDGSPDTLSPEQAEALAKNSVVAFREIIPDAIEEVGYASDIVDGVLQIARDTDATAVAFRPRGGSRVVQFLAGDTALRLVTEADVPVIAIPEVDNE